MPTSLPLALCRTDLVGTYPPLNLTESEFLTAVAQIQDEAHHSFIYRLRLANWLGRAQRASAFYPLLKVLIREHEPLLLRIETIRSIVRLGFIDDTGLVALRSLIKSPKTDRLPGEAALALAYFDDHTSIIDIANLLTNSSRQTQCSAAKALGQFKTSKADQALMAVIEDDLWVASCALEALGNTANPSLVDPLIQLMENSFQKGDWSRAASAAMALGRFGFKPPPGLKNSIEKAYASSSDSGLPEMKQVKIQLAIALLYLGDNRHAQVVTDYLLESDSLMLIYHSLMALSRVGYQKALTTINSNNILRKLESGLNSQNLTVLELKAAHQASRDLEKPLPVWPHLRLGELLRSFF